MAGSSRRRLTLIFSGGSAMFKAVWRLLALENRSNAVVLAEIEW
jgi:hypothetical protein